MNTIIGCDFSLKKPAACVLSNNVYSFYSWPNNIDKKVIEKIKNSGVTIIEREEEKPKKLSATELVHYDIIHSNNLADLIIKELSSFINKNTIFAFEGSSFASQGNVALQLTSWRYILIYKLSLIIPLKNIYTYSPQTLKATAECSKKGMGKKEMIEAFIQKGPNTKFREALINKELFNGGGKNYIDMTDDLVDSFWSIETYIKKEL